MHTLPIQYRSNRRIPIRWAPILTTASTLLSIPLLIIAITLATASQAELRFDLPLQPRSLSLQLDRTGLVYGDIDGAKASSARSYESRLRMHGKLEQVRRRQALLRQARLESGDQKYLLRYEPNLYEIPPLPRPQFSTTSWRHTSYGLTLLDLPVTLYAALVSFALLTATSLRLFLKSLPLRSNTVPDISPSRV